MLSGPVELLFFAVLMAVMTCSVEMWMYVDCNRFVSLSIFLWTFLVVYFVGFVNCLLKAVAICFEVIWVLLPNLIVLLKSCLGFLFDRFWIVFHNMWVFCLWSKFWLSFSFHRFDLCVSISLSISWFSVGNSFSWGLASRIWFLLVIFSLMYSGRSLALLLIFPFGMWCLSAVSMALVNILLAVCMFSEGFVLEMMSSLVYSVQLALL